MTTLWKRGSAARGLQRDQRLHYQMNIEDSLEEETILMFTLSHDLPDRLYGRIEASYREVLTFSISAEVE